MAAGSMLNGWPVVTLAGGVGPDGCGIVRAEIAPGRGMMLLQARAQTPRLGEFDLLHAPPVAEAVRRLSAKGPDDFAGNLSFSFGGAILLPYANRICGRRCPHPREIETEIGGRTHRLPQNWGGRAPGAAQYAMHGLILDRGPQQLSPGLDRVAAHFDLGDFGGRWPSRTSADIEWRLAGGALRLTVRVANVGETSAPMGVGWHPYFALKSGRRAEARLHLPAAARLEVNDYDEVLPTGRLLATAGTRHDFGAPGGAALGDLYLDDCFVHLPTPGGLAHAELRDVAGGWELSLSSLAPPTSAFQVYAPPDQAYVAIEPQLNWPDPFSPVWKGRPTGMVEIQSGDTLTYEVDVAVREFID